MVGFGKHARIGGVCKGREDVWDSESGGSMGMLYWAPDEFVPWCPGGAEKSSTKISSRDIFVHGNFVHGMFVERHFLLEIFSSTVISSRDIFVQRYFRPLVSIQGAVSNF